MIKHSIGDFFSVNDKEHTFALEMCQRRVQRKCKEMRNFVGYDKHEIEIIPHEDGTKTMLVWLIFNNESDFNAYRICR